MILGAEIGLLIYGIYSLATGKYSLSKGKVLTGGKARLLGVLCMLPLPLAFITGVLLGLFFALVLGTAVPVWLSTVTEVLILVVVGVAVTVLGKKYYDEQEVNTLDTPTI